MVYKLLYVIPPSHPHTYTCTRVKVSQKFLPSLCIVLFSLSQPIFEGIFLEIFLIYIVAFIPVLLLALSCDFCIYLSTKTQATTFSTLEWLCRLKAITTLTILIFGFLSVFKPWDFSRFLETLLYIWIMFAILHLGFCYIASRCFGMGIH